MGQNKPQTQEWEKLKRELQGLSDKRFEEDSGDGFGRSTPEDIEFLAKGIRYLIANSLRKRDLEILGMAKQFLGYHNCPKPKCDHQLKAFIATLERIKKRLVNPKNREVVK